MWSRRYVIGTVSTLLVFDSFTSSSGRSLTHNRNYSSVTSLRVESHTKIILTYNFIEHSSIPLAKNRNVVPYSRNIFILSFSSFSNGNQSNREPWKGSTIFTSALRIKIQTVRTATETIVEIYSRSDISWDIENLTSIYGLAMTNFAGYFLN